MTVVAVSFALLPFVAQSPLLPDFGFLFLITWRLLRPEVWSPRHALALGLSALVAGLAILGRIPGTDELHSRPRHRLGATRTARQS